MADETQDENLIVYLTATMNIRNGLIWNTGSKPVYGEHQQPELVISFVVHSHVRERQMLALFKRHLDDAESVGAFVKREKSGFYVLSDVLRREFPSLPLHSWIQGKVKAAYEYFYDDDRQRESLHFRPSPRTHIKLYVTMEGVRDSMPKKIFLSHKSANKSLVREYAKTLEALGLEPWLDEEDLPSGVKLNRALLKGMESSCAAVFFITPDYQDKNYLASEIDAAVSRKMEMEDEFSLIILQIKDEHGEEGIIPTLLRTYVWKTIEYSEQLRGLREILKSLPFETKILM